MSPPSLESTENRTEAEEACTSVTPSLSQYSSDASTSSRAKKKKKASTRPEDIVLEKVARQLNLQIEDKFDVSGKGFANKLRDLPAERAVVTEKLINDLLFEAQMGNINRYSKVIIIQDTKPVPVTIYKPQPPPPQPCYNIHNTNLESLDSLQTITQVSDNQPAQFYSEFCQDLYHSQYQNETE